MVAELIERLTQKVRIKQEKGDAIFYEEKILKPDRKNITVDTKQVYIPVWQIRGKKIVEVNAFTGELLSEPMDEGCRSILKIPSIRLFLIAPDGVVPPPSRAS